MKSSTLPQAMFLKKQTKADEQALANRVSLLEHEEKRTYKKLEETQRKLKELHLVRELKHGRRKLQEEARYKQAKDLKLLSETLKQVRQNRKRMQEFANISMYQAKLTACEQVRQKQQQGLRRRQGLELHRLTEYKQLIQTVKKEALLRTERIQNFRLRRIEECHSDIHKKQVEDFKYVSQKEQEVKQLEQFESHMVQRLQSTQQEYQHALDELEAVTARTTRYVDAHNSTTS